MSGRPDDTTFPAVLSFRAEENGRMMHTVYGAGERESRNLPFRAQHQLSLQRFRLPDQHGLSTAKTEDYRCHSLYILHVENIMKI